MCFQDKGTVLNKVTVWEISYEEEENKVLVFSILGGGVNIYFKVGRKYCNLIVSCLEQDCQ